MTAVPTQEMLISSVRQVRFDNPAILRGISLVPKRLRAEYYGKLNHPTQREGIIHELRVIGKLARPIPNFRMTPYPDGEHFDALLHLGKIGAELEITALIKPAYAVAVDRVCQRIELFLKERFPHKVFDVKLGNFGAGFIEKKNKRGTVTLDEDSTFKLCAEQIEKVIDPNGTVPEEWQEFGVRGPIVTIRPAQITRALQGSFVLPADTHVQQVKRKVFGKLKKSQWTGNRPALLAVVLVHSPQTRLLNEAYDNVCDKAFAKCPHLTAIIALPFGNILDRPTVYVPENPSGMQALQEESKNVLTRAFRFWIGVNRRFALHELRYVREEMKKKGVWPGWKNARLA